ncbi:predicted protein [Sparassis crispa]|uniref:DUF6533 domain-containing protein n=1 Tax=Sparassis crispa TaxID=139825 RepID=A0A401G663_9APHY|nr:predicted protein [Sparassis crispa]GBE77637.1 predicted protein [Sparassis crispa]
MIHDTSQLEQDVVNLTTTGRIWYISMVLLLYDYCLTLCDEVHHVWRSRSLRGRLIFFTNRYWPIAFMVFDSVVLRVFQTSDTGVMVNCHFFFQWAVYSPIPSSISLGIILISKLHAMYGCNRTLLAVMCTLLVVEIVATAAAGGIAAYKMRAVTVAAHTGCFPGNDYAYDWSFWVPPLGFEAFLFALALWKVVQEVRDDMQTSRLMVVLLRDSIFYFGAACTILLINFFVWLFRPALLGAFVPLVTTCRSIIGCRMLLNIQEAAEMTADTPSDILPSIQFRTFTVNEEGNNKECSRDMP